MRTIALAFVVFLVTAGSVSRAQQKPDRLMLVVHADNKVAKVTKSTVKAMYMGQTTFWSSDLRAKPYNRVHTSAAGKPFFRDVLGMAPSRYRHHWQKQQLSGQGVEPEVVGSAAAVVSKVAANQGALGYILESEAAAADARVRVLPIE